jgi:hypothetical protein
MNRMPSNPPPLPVTVDPRSVPRPQPVVPLNPIVGNPCGQPSVVIPPRAPDPHVRPLK